MTIQAESRQAEVVFDSELTRQCKARNARGEPCGAAPVNGADYCYMHAPELATLPVCGEGQLCWDQSFESS